MTTFKFLFKISPFIYLDVANLSIWQKVKRIYKCYKNKRNPTQGYFEENGDEIGINLSSLYSECNECVDFGGYNCICPLIKHEYIHKAIYDCIGSGKRPGEERIVSLLER